ncbi:MAG: hypothetical protein GF331_25405 [Chitinivibrionales bacterium]|nr:hypothetical protein [Chitinivibrionales bacterium]
MPRILWIDSSRDSVDKALALFDGVDYTIAPARSAAEALKQLHGTAGGIDGVVLDVTLLRGDDGLGLLAALCATSPPVPVVEFAGYPTHLGQLLSARMDPAQRRLKISRQLPSSYEERHAFFGSLAQAFNLRMPAATQPRVTPQQPTAQPPRPSPQNGNDVSDVPRDHGPVQQPYAPHPQDAFIPGGAPRQAEELTPPPTPQNDVAESLFASSQVQDIGSSFASSEQESTDPLFSQSRDDDEEIFGQPRVAEQQPSFALSQGEELGPNSNSSERDASNSLFAPHGERFRPSFAPPQDDDYRPSFAPPQDVERRQGGRGLSLRGWWWRVYEMRWILLLLYTLTVAGGTWLLVRATVINPIIARLRWTERRLDEAKAQHREQMQKVRRHGSGKVPTPREKDRDVDRGEQSSGSRP